MNCQSVIRELSNYIDGGLELSAKQELERHLGHCEHCKMVVDQTKLTVDLFCDAQPVELPPALRLRLHEALRRKFAEKGT